MAYSIKSPKVKEKKERKFSYSKDGYANSSVMAMKVREYMKKGYSQKQAEKKANKFLDKLSLSQTIYSAVTHTGN